MREKLETLVSLREKRKVKRNKRQGKEVARHTKLTSIEILKMCLKDPSNWDWREGNLKKQNLESEEKTGVSYKSTHPLDTLIVSIWVG